MLTIVYQIILWAWSFLKKKKIIPTPPHTRRTLSLYCDGKRSAWRWTLGNQHKTQICDATHEKGTYGLFAWPRHRPRASRNRWWHWRVYFSRLILIQRFTPSSVALTDRARTWDQGSFRWEGKHTQRVCATSWEENITHERIAQHLGGGILLLGNVIVLLFPVVDHNSQHRIWHQRISHSCACHRRNLARVQPLNNSNPFVWEPIIQDHWIAHDLTRYRAEKLHKGFWFRWRRRWPAGTLFIFKHLDKVHCCFVVVDLAFDRALGAKATHRKIGVICTPNTGTFITVKVKASALCKRLLGRTGAKVTDEHFLDVVVVWIS